MCKGPRSFGDNGLVLTILTKFTSKIQEEELEDTITTTCLPLYLQSANTKLHGRDDLVLLI